MTNYNERVDEILAKHNGELGVTWEDPDVVTPDTKQAIVDWHNKQVREMLDRLEQVHRANPLWVGMTQRVIPLSAIEAERARLEAGL